MAGLITLTTDFGLQDSYVAAVRGVILSVNPNARLIDVTHEAPPQDIAHGAYVIGAAYPYFPPDTIHLVVVDPGVGTRRRALAVRTPNGIFVGPDNGVLAWAYESHRRLSARSRTHAPMQPYRVALPAAVQAVELTERRYWRREVSSTFNGRDIFAPVAAHLSLGVPLSALGRSVRRVVSLAQPLPERRPDGSLSGYVVHQDRFGNLITNLPQKMLPHGAAAIEIGGKRIEGLSRSYQEGRGLLALVGSQGTLEIALNNGSAAAYLRVTVGERVTVRAAKE